MKTVFADTFFWIALVSQRDAAHGRAIDVVQGQSYRMVTTEWVLTEVADGFSQTRHRHLVEQLRQLWKSDPNLRIVEASHDLYERGLDLFCSRPDKDWSLTDCISFVVMKEEAIAAALSADHHFEQAGFVSLLK